MINEQWNDLTMKFVEVRNTLNKNNHQYAYRMAFKQPWKFYRENTICEAINILMEKYPD